MLMPMPMPMSTRFCWVAIPSCFFFSLLYGRGWAYHPLCPHVYAMPMPARFKLVAIPSFFFFGSKGGGRAHPPPMPLPMLMPIRVRSGFSVLVSTPFRFFFCFEDGGRLAIPYAHARADAHAKPRAF